MYLPPPQLGSPESQRRFESISLDESMGFRSSSADYHGQSMGFAGSSADYRGPGPRGTRMPKWHEDCAEEMCDPELCGDQNQGPRGFYRAVEPDSARQPGYGRHGYDPTYGPPLEHEESGDGCIDEPSFEFELRHLLPLCLLATTLLGGISLCAWVLPIANEGLGGDDISFGLALSLETLLIVFTLLLISYCTLADPGKLNNHAYTNMVAPRRSHKSWQYSVPIRRYDHYCRWVTNCIGLLNHREFILMCINLVFIGLIGMVVDVVALIAAISKHYWLHLIVIVCHLAYSLILFTLASPILKMHLGFVSRNELAQEWRDNDFYVVRSSYGGKVRVNELPDGEFDDRQDDFEYDPKLNEYDDGCLSNWWSFWCVSRASPLETGDF